MSDANGREAEVVVREYLEARGCADHIVRGGLSGLVGAWEQLAAALERGYDGQLDEYLNDLDTRDILEDALDVAALPDDDALRERVSDADARVRAATEPCGPLWGDAVADAEAMDPALQWWYYIRPRRPGPDLRADLEAEGLAGG